MLINEEFKENTHNFFWYYENTLYVCIRKTLQADYRKGLVREASLFPILKV